MRNACPAALAAGRMLGWSLRACLFIGCIVALSSSAVVLRSLRRRAGVDRAQILIVTLPDQVMERAVIKRARRRCGLTDGSLPEEQRPQILVGHEPTRLSENRAQSPGGELAVERNGERLSRPVRGMATELCVAAARCHDLEPEMAERQKQFPRGKSSQAWGHQPVRALTS